MVIRTETWIHCWFTRRGPLHYRCDSCSSFAFIWGPSVCFIWKIIVAIMKLWTFLTMRCGILQFKKLWKFLSSYILRRGFGVIVHFGLMMICSIFKFVVCANVLLTSFLNHSRRQIVSCLVITQYMKRAKHGIHWFFISDDMGLYIQWTLLQRCAWYSSPERWVFYKLISEIQTISIVSRMDFVLALIMVMLLK